MTTVIIDFKAKKIVTDKQRTCTSLKYNLFSSTYTELDGQVSYEQVHKIHNVGDGVYLVGSGSSSEVGRQVTHYRERGTVDINAQGEVCLAIARVKGSGLFVDTYTYKKNRWSSGGKLTHKVIQGNDNVITFGSGGNYAWGAFMAGCSAEDSVRAASKCDQYTSYEIDVVQL